MEYGKIYKKLTKLSALLPFIYLIFITMFFFWVSIEEGNYPTYGKPDPKNYLILHFISTILMLLIPISFITWLVLIFQSIIRLNWKEIKYEFLFGVFGFLLIILLIKFDPMGILNWLAD